MRRAASRQRPGITSYPGGLNGRRVLPYAEATVGEKIRLEPFEGTELDMSLLLAMDED